MKKKETVAVELKMQGDQEIVSVPTSGEVTEPKFLTEFLNRGIRNKNIKFGKKIRGENYTKYIYNVQVLKNGEKQDYNFVVRVKNSEKSLHYQTLKHIEALCDISVRIKRENKLKIAALVIAGAIALTAGGKWAAKNLKEKTITSSSTPGNTIVYVPTEEDIEKANEEYYKELEQRANEGDPQAIEEYNMYLMEQQLEQQLEEERKVR